MTLTDTNKIKICINAYLNKGLINKMDIYTKVSQEYGIGLSEVRKISRELRTDMLEKVAILQGNLNFQEYSKRR